MKNIIIIGAGGFAKELFGYLQSEIEKGIKRDYRIKGFMDISLESFSEMNIDSEYLGAEDDYSPEVDDEFLLAIGSVDLKEKIVTVLRGKGAHIMTYIHSTAIVDKASVIGEGVVICPFCMVNNQAIIGDYSMLNIYSSIAHDSSIGDYSILSPYATINGDVKAGEKLFMATRSSILPGIKVGKQCVVSAGTIVAKDMSDSIMAMPKSRTAYVERRA